MQIMPKSPITDETLDNIDDIAREQLPHSGPPVLDVNLYTAYSGP